VTFALSPLRSTSCWPVPKLTRSASASSAIQGRCASSSERVDSGYFKVHCHSVSDVEIEAFAQIVQGPNEFTCLALRDECLGEFEIESYRHLAFGSQGVAFPAHWPKFHLVRLQPDACHFDATRLIHLGLKL
jgi:hypothetical protein